MSSYTLLIPQTYKLIPQAQEIKTTFENLQRNPESKDLQKKYIAIFPDNSVLFKKIFSSPTFDQLYMDSGLYISKLSELSTDYQDIIGTKFIKLCVEFKKWDADAIGYIQHSTMEFANIHYYSFIKLCGQLNKQDLTILITFLADKENHKAYGIYQEFMDKLKINNESELHLQFMKAREERIKKKDH
jgi:hypothetical protein